MFIVIQAHHHGIRSLSLPVFWGTVAIKIVPGQVRVKGPYKMFIGICGGFLRQLPNPFLILPGREGQEALELMGFGAAADDASPGQSHGLIDLGAKDIVVAVIGHFKGDPAAEIGQQSGDARCLGCGICANTCPKKIINMIPQETTTVVMCSNKQKGADARKACKNACIGCKKCEKACQYGAITVVDNLAQIDYNKCIYCGLCVNECPTGCLKKVFFPNLPEDSDE
jgi:formate hydrogenlyase subunit 6/NADH:ubiquinone oxidoreductase subunit I